VLDVRDESSTRNVVAQAADRLGGLDTLVTCVGVATAAATHETSLDSWESVIQINLTGTFLSIKPGVGLS
jgi:NAD(P)-dependent dehydrogenase (short-subunit alcohol dehydrogenase family)